MATYNGVNFALVAAGNKVPAGELSGDLQVAYEEYTSAAALVAADVINTGIKLAPNRRVYQVIVTSPTNGGTVSVGIAGAATKYASAAAAGATTVVSPVLKSGTTEEDIILTIGGAPSAAGLYKVAIYHAKV